MSNMQEMRIVLPTPEKLLTPGVVVLLSLMVVGFAATAWVPDAVMGLLALTPQGILHGRIWQLVTYPFVNGPGSLLFNGLVVLFVGSAIEREWRTASLLWLWFTVSITCGILWIVLTVLFRSPAVGLGAGACAYGIIATMGLLFRGRRYLFFLATVEAQHIAIILIALGIILGIASPINLVWVSGALVGYIYVKVRLGMRTRPSVRRAPPGPGGGGQFVDID